MSICSKLTSSLFAILVMSFSDLVSEVTKYLISSTQLAWAKIFASLGMISLLSIMISLAVLASYKAFANLPATVACWKLNGMIRTLRRGSSETSPFTQYSAMVIVETCIETSFSRKYLKYPTALVCKLSFAESNSSLIL